jgi:hypothetical protein
MIHLLFGAELQSIDDLSQLVSASLGVVLKKHDSLFYGGDYYRSDDVNGEVILQTKNDGGPPSEYAEEDFPEYPILLYVATEEKDMLLKQLAKCGAKLTFLRESIR